MEGRARAPGAGTVLNAFACGKGSAFAIEDAYLTATVHLDAGIDGVEGAIAGEPDADTRLIERCVTSVLDRYAERDLGGRVRTESNIPMAAGLKSSSAAANATVLATLDALDVPIDDQNRDRGRNQAESGISRIEAARIGVEAARETGVSVTGAFDDASASMLGGVTVTDNATDELLAQEVVEWDVLIWTPPERAYSGDVDLDRYNRVASIGEFIAETALDRRYAEAMTMNGFVACALFDVSADPLIEALPDARGVSLSGSGPSVTAIGARDALTDIEARWSERAGTTWLTTTQTDGARTI